ncbi:TPA: ABC transporter permease subunit [Escherichia coli]|nr:ABC transporter permease subunit [Escherichia coli]
MLYGFSGVILQGALVTLELAISSVVLAVIIGLIGAGGKLSQNRLSGLIFEGYTTLIRGVPDLVLMLLIFYGLQIALNTVTEAMMRYALPGIGNNWQVILKSTALVSLLGLEDVVKATQLAGKSTWEPFYFAIVCGVIYLVFTTVSNGVLLFLERRYSVGVKRADL